MLLCSCGELPMFVDMLPYSWQVTHYGNITWVPWHLKSFPAWLSVQEFVRDNLKNHLRSTLLAVCEGNHWLADSPHKGPVMRKVSPSHHISMMLTHQNETLILCYMVILNKSKVQGEFRHVPNIFFSYYLQSIQHNEIDLEKIISNNSHLQAQLWVYGWHIQVHIEVHHNRVQWDIVVTLIVWYPWFHNHTPTQQSWWVDSPYYICIMHKWIYPVIFQVVFSFVLKV